MKPFTFTFFLVVITITLARAHPEIEEACNHYNTLSSNGIESCMLILKALPNYIKHNDKKALALASLDLAEAKFMETSDKIKNKIQDKSLNPKVLGALHRCLRLYNDGSYSLGFGDMSFREQDFHSENYQWIRDATYVASQCELELNNAGVKGEDFRIETDYMLQVSNAAQAAFNCFSAKLKSTPPPHPID